MSKRIKYFLGHLSISVLIALIVIGIVFFIWYPSPLAKAVGVTHIFLMLMSIDVVVGPLLSLLVYKEGKKTLKMDLTVIALIQLSALCYGIYNIQQGRPVWIVQNVDRFELVRNNDLELDQVDKAQPQYQIPSWFKPQFVAVQQAKTIEEQNKTIFADVMSGISASTRPERYTSLAQEKQQLILKAQDLEKLKAFNDVQHLQQILTQYPEANAFVPLKANEVDMTVLINKDKGKVVQIVDLRPWG